MITAKDRQPIGSCFMKLISFIIPCYCSQDTLETVVCEITDTMSQLSAYQYEVILVNDCSPDQTFAVITSLAKRYCNITGIDLAKNFGQHAALRPVERLSSVWMMTVRPRQMRPESCWRKLSRATMWYMPPTRISGIPVSATGGAGSTAE